MQHNRPVYTTPFVEYIDPLSYTQCTIGMCPPPLLHSIQISSTHNHTRVLQLNNIRRRYNNPYHSRLMIHYSFNNSNQYTAPIA
jgi:hypothetical protein